MKSGLRVSYNFFLVFPLGDGGFGGGDGGFGGDGGGGDGGKLYTDMNRNLNFVELYTTT